MRKLILLTAFLWPLSATAHTCILNQQQQQTLQAALHIGNKVGIGKQLAAVAFQESSLGVEPDSPGHFGVGSIGYAAWQIVIHAHPWLQHYFHHHNWATVLVSNTTIALWVSAYYIKYCREHALNWWQAMQMYRYGSPDDTGNYPNHINHRLAQIHHLLMVSDSARQTAY
ncbi:hypothetical protein AAE485_15215 (plasmid) [Acidithiobacillus ferriphilus]|uniref:hypothetical protein n=1 Tax=Acidithiobacillus TaxID=119977 RepID=UPI002DB7945B|nr:hypothetical protein [Acidithiobacillus ferriphilus]MEB8474026.1 hypothetical protein [Acidithiobacillus ferriphilus]